MSQPTTSALPTTKPTLFLALTLGALPGLFLLITSTVHLVEGEFIYDVKRLLQLCLMLVLFLAAAINPGLRNAFAEQFNRIPGWVQALLGLIIALGVISSAVNATSGMHLAYSLLEVALLTMLVIAVLVIAACRAVAGEHFDQVAITLLAMTAIAVGFQELLGVAAALANDLEFYFRISLMHYSWPRFYNQVQAWTLPVIAALPLIWSRSRSELLQSKWLQVAFCLGALALHWYLILMTGGRGVALSLLASFVICLLLFPATRRPSLRWHLPGLLLGAVLYFAIIHVQDQAAEADVAQAAPETTQPAESGRANPDDWYTEEGGETKFSRQSMAGRMTFDSSGRMRTWRNAVREIRKHPVLGIGPMNIACTGPDARWAHPHNFAIQFVQEWGVPAGAILLAALGWLGFLIFGRLRSQAAQPSIEVAVPSLLVTGLVAAGAYSMLSGVLVMPASQVAGILVGGWLLGLTPVKPSAKRLKAVLALSTLTTILLVCTAVTGFSFIEAGKREYRTTFIPVPAQGAPRYWQQGKLCSYFDRY